MKLNEHSCVNCLFRKGTPTMGDCIRSGTSLYSTRSYSLFCDKDFSGWIQREPWPLRFLKWLVWL